MQHVIHYHHRAAGRFRRTEAWRVLVGFLVIVFFALVPPGIVLAAYIFGQGITGIAPGQELGQDVALIILGTFIFWHIGVLIAGRLLHGVGVGVLIGQQRGIYLKGFLVGMVVVFAIHGPITLISLPFDPLTANLALDQWLIWLVPVMLLVLIQVSAEELFFRGYLQGALAARFSTPAIWLGVPAVLFGLAHAMNTGFGSNTILIVAATGLMGLVLGDVTARTGNIWTATGIHYANNLFGILVVATPGQLSGFGLFHNSVDPLDEQSMRFLLLANIAVIALAYGIYLIWVRRQPIDTEPDEEIAIFE